MVCQLAADLYNILGVERTSDRHEIKSAYRSLSQKYHPDKANDDGITEEEVLERFQEIQAAYDTLGDPTKRARYDQRGHVETVQSKDSRAFSTISQLFSQQLVKSNYQRKDYTDLIRNTIKQQKVGFEASAEKMEDALSNVKSLVESYTDAPAIEAALTQQLEVINSQLQTTKDNIDIANTALEIIESYKYTGPAELPGIRSFTVTDDGCFADLEFR